MADIHKKEKGAAKKVKEKVAQAPKHEKKETKKEVINEAPKKERKPKTENRKPAFDAWTVLKTPYLTEKSTRMIESQNKLVFLVADRASKAEIKQAVEAAFSVKVDDVNTTSTMRGEKKAYVRLKPEFKAIDIATKLGMM